MIEMKNLHDKYKEIIFYLIVGGLTTLVNIAVYFIFKDIFFVDYRISNGLAWLISVLFAFIPNKYLVFQATSSGKNTVLKELALFVGYRLLSLGIDMLLMILFISVLNINDVVSKLVVQMAVIILNYVFSKLFIFSEVKGVNVNDN